MNEFITPEKTATQRLRLRVLLESGHRLTNIHIQKEMNISGSTARLSELRREFKREGKELASHKNSAGCLVYFLRWQDEQ